MLSYSRIHDWKTHLTRQLSTSVVDVDANMYVCCARICAVTDSSLTGDRVSKCIMLSYQQWQQMNSTQFKKPVITFQPKNSRSEFCKYVSRQETALQVTSNRIFHYLSSKSPIQLAFIADKYACNIHYKNFVNVVLTGFNDIGTKTGPVMIVISSSSRIQF